MFIRKGRSLQKKGINENVFYGKDEKDFMEISDVDKDVVNFG